MSTLVGMQLSGRYRLDAQIGAGGMSTVYRAFDVNLERGVAITSAQFASSCERVGGLHGAVRPSAGSQRAQTCRRRRSRTA